MGNALVHPTGQPIGITMGDAAGIGPEIILKLFQKGLPTPAVVYGDAGVLHTTAQRLGIVSKLDIQAYDSLEQYQTGRSTTPLTSSTIVPVINRRAPLPADLTPGLVDARAGQAAYDYLCHAIDDALEGGLRAIVTAPLNKEAMNAAGIHQPGHTEILAEKTGTQHYAMMLAGPDLRVILATIHIPLMEVSRHLTIDTELNTIRLAHQACRQAGIDQPRIAVAGLNPHAGEAGRFGQEEITIIEPAIKQARQEGINVSGPWPGDTIFMRARQGEFDIVVAQYHDQGLIPIKLLGLDEGVNITVGLPFVRTSVDHGTAFDIAGQGIAEPASLEAAVRMAVEMVGNNQEA